MLLLDEGLPTLHLELTLPKTAQELAPFKGKVIPKPEAGSSEPVPSIFQVLLLAVSFREGGFSMTPINSSGVFGGGIPDLSGKTKATRRKIQDFNCFLKSNKLFDAVTSKIDSHMNRRKKAFFLPKANQYFHSTPWDLILSKLLGLWTGGKLFFWNVRFFVHQNSDIFPRQKSLSPFFGKPWTFNTSCHSWGSYVLLWRVLVGQKIFIFSPMWDAKKNTLLFPHELASTYEFVCSLYSVYIYIYTDLLVAA